MIDFKTITYLKSGTLRQRSAYTVLKKLNVFEHLKEHSPILTGTIPIDIDLPDSDLDIICECKDHAAFGTTLSTLFSGKQNFQLNFCQAQGMPATVATFETTDFKIEIFGQNLPTVQQRAFRHMIVEYQILEEKGIGFKSQIKKLKSKGYKTEPAFAKLLGLDGDPYESLLKIGE